jgi:hypothetical protein
MGNIRLQLAAARAVIYELDMAQEARPLTALELQKCRELKQHVLSLTSLSRTMACQCARTQQLKEGDACTRYFHLQACHCRRKNYLFAINHNGQMFTEEEAKANIVFSYYNGLLGTRFTREHCIDLSQLPLPWIDLEDQALPFSAADVATAVTATASGHAPGPDGLSVAFYKATCSIIRADVMRAFHALWSMDFTSFHLLNEAVMVLLCTDRAQGLQAHQPHTLHGEALLQDLGPTLGTTHARAGQPQPVDIHPGAMDPRKF